MKNLDFKLRERHRQWAQNHRVELIFSIEYKDGTRIPKFCEVCEFRKVCPGTCRTLNKFLKDSGCGAIPKDQDKLVLMPPTSDLDRLANDTEFLSFNKKIIRSPWLSVASLEKTFPQEVYNLQAILTGQQIEYIKLRYEGWSFGEIARVYGVSKQSVEQCISRARRRITRNASLVHELLGG